MLASLRRCGFWMLFAAAAAAQSQIVFHSNGDFSGTTWETLVFKDAASSATITYPPATGRHPGVYYQADVQSASIVYVVAFAKEGIYDPQRSGPFKSFDWSLDLINLTGVDIRTEGFGPAVRTTRDNKIYLYTRQPASPPNVWTNFPRPGVAAGDLEELNLAAFTSNFTIPFTNPSSHPDFSLGPVQFGFWFSRSTVPQAATSQGFDNWAVTIASSAPPPPNTAACNLSPSNTLLPFHDPQETYDAVYNPPHTLSVNVLANGSPAAGVSVNLTASRAAFSTSPSVPPTLTSATAQTDAAGRATFTINPRAAAGFEETDFEAAGVAVNVPFKCTGSVVVGIGTITALTHPPPTPGSGLLAGLAMAIFPSAVNLWNGFRPPAPAPPRDLNQWAANAKPTIERLIAHLRKNLEIGSSSGLRAQAAPLKFGNASAEAMAIAPLGFEPNAGKTASDVNYRAQGDGYEVNLAPAEIVISEPGGAVGRGAARIRFAGGNPSPNRIALEELPGKSHYFLGRDAAHWRTGTAKFAKVVYENAYPGVDVVFHGRSQLEVDFIVDSGARPEQIDLAFNGVDRLELDRSGNLLLHLRFGILRLERPLVYQKNRDVRTIVNARYLLRPRHHVGFEVRTYDRQKPLVIDPVVSYATYLGGGNHDGATAIAVDAQGNTYVAGSTTSADFPSANTLRRGLAGTLPLGDVFVTRLNPSGQVVYYTYIGGSGQDLATAIAVDSSGNAYVTGITNSPDFPVTQALQPLPGGGPPGRGEDAFVFKLNAAGSTLVYSTYLGGAQQDRGRGIAVDGLGNAYVVGSTSSTDFPVKNALQAVNRSGSLGASNAFITKLNPAGTDFVYSTYLGGTGINVANAVAVDAAGNAYVTGAAASGFPLVKAIQGSNNGARDAFVAKLNAAGSALLYSTYLGGEGDDFGTGIAVDAAGNAYVTGTTGSANFPVVNAAQAKPGAASSLGFDVFITKISADGSTLAYSTFLGGGGVDVGTGIAVGPDGAVYVAGETSSADFPVINPIQTAPGGMDDAFVARLDPSGAFTYSTTLGGAGHDMASGVAFHPSGVYLAGISMSSDYPVAYGAPQAALQGQSDAVLTKIVEGTAPPKLSTFQAAALTPGGPAAPNAIVTGFGQNLAAGLQQATLPLPTILAGTTVAVKDSAGHQELAPLYFVSAGQINYVIPESLAAGLAQVTVTNGSQVAAAGTVRIAAVAPGLFSANADGKGAAAAVALKVAADGTQTSQLVFQCGSVAGSCVVAPIDLGGASDQVFLLLFGTGIQRRSSLAAVALSVGGKTLPVAYAGPQGDYPGLDQINAGPLPQSLRGRGPVEVALVVDGEKANSVAVSIR